MKFKMILSNTLTTVLTAAVIFMAAGITITALMIVGVGIFYTENIVLPVINIILNTLITVQLLTMLFNSNYKITAKHLKINYGFIPVKIPLLTIYTADIRQDKVCIYYVYKNNRKALTININPKKNLLFTDSLTKAQHELIDSEKFK